MKNYQFFLNSYYFFSLFRWQADVSDSEVTHVSHNVTNFEFLYEPFYVAPDTVPPHDERFLGYGYTRNTQVSCALHSQDYTISLNPTPPPPACCELFALDLLRWCDRHRFISQSSFCWVIKNFLHFAIPERYGRRAQVSTGRSRHAGHSSHYDNSFHWTHPVVVVVVLLGRFPKVHKNW